MAAVTIFKYLAEDITQDKVDRSTEWFRQAASGIRYLNAQDVIKEQRSNAVSRIKLGHLYLFNYDALTKDVLPYYDKFPIVFVIKPMKEGFLGLNMHYLPYNYRAKLMDALYSYVTGEEDMQRLRITYRILSESSKLKYFRPCLKHYLNNQIRSRFIHITPNQWDTAIFLPLQKFIGARQNIVHRDSVRLIRKYNTRGRVI